MTKILVVCGAGVATSTVVIERLKGWLKQKNLLNEVELHQGKVHDNRSQWGNYDAIISTTMVPDFPKEAIIDGIPLLTGIGTDKVYTQLSDKMAET